MQAKSTNPRVLLHLLPATRLWAPVAEDGLRRLGAADPTVRRAPNGRPLAPEGYDVAVTTVEDLRLIATSVGVRIGIDAERRHRRLAFPRQLAARCLDVDERALVEAALPARRPALLLRLWTLKEALLKLTGDGLAGRPASCRCAAALATPDGTWGIAWRGSQAYYGRSWGAQELWIALIAEAAPLAPPQIHAGGTAAAELLP